jgi:catechol O-methyltransferase
MLPDRGNIQPKNRGKGPVMRKLSAALVPAAVSAASMALLAGRRAAAIPRWALWAGASFGAALTANELAGKPVPVLRWSVLRFLLGQRRLMKDWQVGDGREEALARHVTAHARPGDIDDVIRVIDDFAYHQSFLINIGDRKGAILDEAVRHSRPQRLLELGTYCGYSALRIARAMPSGAHLYSVEFNPANAAIARRVWQHAGVSDRITVIVGTLGDGGSTLATLRDEHGFTKGGLDFVFLDHAKDQYLPDLTRIRNEDWLHPGSVVVADNVRFPGAPDYLAYLRAEEGKAWHTSEHRTYAEYQTFVKDLVTVSEYLGT